MPDDGAPHHHLGRVVVGQAGFRVDAAGAEERPVGVELGEERLRVAPEQAASPCRTWPPAQQDLDVSRPDSSSAAGTELVSTRPRKLAGSARATSSAVVPTSMTIVSSGSTSDAASAAMARLASMCRAAAGREAALAGPAGRAGRAAVDPVQQPVCCSVRRSRRMVSTDTSNSPGQVLGGDRAVLPYLGQDRLAALRRQHARHLRVGRSGFRRGAGAMELGHYARC